MRNASGGATLSLAAGGIRGRRKIKGGHIIHIKNHSNAMASPSKNEDSSSKEKGYQTPDSKRLKVTHTGPVDALVGEANTSLPQQSNQTS